MEYYYIGTTNPDIILKTEKLVTDDVTSFEAVIVRMSDRHQEELAHEVGDHSEGWCPAYFKLMTDEDLKNEGITREYLYREWDDGSYTIVREVTYSEDGKKFDGLLDYFSSDKNEDMFIGNPVSGNTSDYNKIDGMERDSLILLERENLEMFDNWLTPSNSTILSYDRMTLPEQKNVSPKFTVIYSEMEDIMTQKYVVKYAHSTDYEYDELVDFVSSLNENPFKINFVFEGHINPYSHE